jgi:hypothetical protein
MRLEDINLLDRDVFAQGVPPDWFTLLRRALSHLSAF